MRPRFCPADCLRYETLISTATGADVASYRLRASQVLPGQLASIIYTSGTTGEPKGVMLTHTNFCSNVSDSCHNVKFESKDDVAISFLPLAHVYGRTLDYVYLFHGVTIAYVEAVEHVAQALLEIHPTLLGAVPRVFEKIYARVVEQGSKQTGYKRKIFDWAMEVASRSALWRSGEKNTSSQVKLAWGLADKLVYSKIREGTGGKLRLVFSGGAPLAKELAEFFWAIGVPIYQGYGLTETAPVLTSNYPNNRMGSAGKPIPNVELRIAEDGEILAKGPCVMQGYFKSAEATREVLTADGWFSTGDIGYLDKDNYLFITDRKKDLIKTAAGKFVAPQPIENALKTSRLHPERRSGRRQTQIHFRPDRPQSHHSRRQSRRAGHQVLFQQRNGRASRCPPTHRSRSKTPNRQPSPIRNRQTLRPPPRRLHLRQRQP